MLGIKGLEMKHGVLSPVSTERHRIIMTFNFVAHHFNAAQYNVAIVCT